MKILIVEDNATNRLMLSSLLQSYAQENQLSFEISEAKDGAIAVQKCTSEYYDFVFMDINMPNMNGIEASKKIRELNEKSMIIAVSTSDDIDQRREILNSGAEDYISKPIDVDVFKSRMKNYLSLLEARQNKVTTSARFINLFSNEIYNRHTTFLLDSEDALAEFWEFFLLNVRDKSNDLSDVVRVIVDIVDRQMKLAPTNKLYIEESENKQYFTLINIDILPQKVIELIVQKNGLESGYKLTNSKISFELFKTKEISKEQEQPHVVEEKQVQSVSTSQEPQETQEVEVMQSRELEVQDYLDEEDLIDLEEFVSKLNSVMLIVGYGDVMAEDVSEICTNLERVSAILSSYSEVYPISVALADLAQDMSSHVEEFTQNSEALGPMCKAFATDLANWVEQSFHTGSPSADFMNDTIVVNCQTIGSMLKMNEESVGGEDDFDDIFDF